MGNEARLNAKQKKFIQKYLICFNATKAAIYAGYSKKTAYSIGQRLLKDVEIKAAIAAAQKKDEDRYDITKEKWLAELAIVFFSDIKDYVEINNDTGAIRAKAFDGMPEKSSRAIQSIQEDRIIKESSNGEQTTVHDIYKFRLHDKLKAGEMIGKHFGYLPLNSGDDKTDPKELNNALMAIADAMRVK
jgi:phage terminase small subunit